MAKLGLFVSLTAIVAALGFASVSSIDEAQAADACHRKEFKTELVKKACTEGGQAKAKEVMKAWNKEKGIKSCNDCHSKLAPTYDLKADGLAKYQKAGGK